MNEEDVFLGFSKLYIDIARFIDNNKIKIRKNFSPKILTKRKKVNGVIHGLHTEFGKNMFWTVSRVYSDYIFACLNSSYSACHAISSIIKTKNRAQSSNTQMVIMRVINEVLIKINYITYTEPIKSTQFLCATEIETLRKFYNEQGESEKARTQNNYFHLFGNYPELLKKIDLPVFEKLSNITNKTKGNLTVANKNTSSMIDECKESINSHFKSFGFGEYNHEKIKYHQDIGNQYSHINPFMLNTKSYNDKFWIIAMTIPKLITTCYISTKFLPQYLHEKKKDKLKTFAKRYQELTRASLPHLDMKNLK